MTTVHYKALPKPNTNFKKKSFSYRGAKAWNGISSDLKSAKSIFSFKTKINYLQADMFIDIFIFYISVEYGLLEEHLPIFL